MKILFFAHTGKLGGAELALTELVSGLAKTDAIEPHVVLPRPGPLAVRLEQAGGEVHYARHYPWASSSASHPWLRAAAMSLLNLTAVAHAVLLLRRIRPDAVVSASMISPIGALSASLSNIPHLWMIQEFGDLDHGYRFLLGMPGTARAIRQLSKAATFCSGAVEARMMPYLAGVETGILYNAVTIATDRGPVPAPGRPLAPRLVLVGKKSKAKGQEDALRALRILVEDGVDAELVLLGEEEPGFEHRLSATARRLGIADRIDFVRFVPDPTPFLDAADIVLMCSRKEAFGRVTVEAFKRGRPVVGARAGGTIELIEESGGGLLYDPGDETSLANAIRMLAANPAEARRLGEQGRRWAQMRCNEERHTADFLDVLRRVLPDLPHAPSGGT